MSYPLALLSVFSSLFLISVLTMYFRSRQQRLFRDRLQHMPFPETWRSILEKTVHYPGMAPEARRSIERALLAFAHTRRFRGIGLEITDEVKAVIAFYACYMVRRRPDYDYPSVSEIIVYADEFVANEHHEQGGIVTEGPAVLDGQSSLDTVVLSWYDARDEAYHPSEHNVIIHEFAHILDFEDGLSDGLPPLPKAKRQQWDHIIAHDFRELENAASHGHLSHKHQLLGTYAATNEAEFFAVASERYFMIPGELKEHYPKLYDLLADFYG
jgi:MtfA peptidase